MEFMSRSGLKWSARWRCPLYWLLLKPVPLRTLLQAIDDVLESAVPGDEAAGSTEVSVDGLSD